MSKETVRDFALGTALPSSLSPVGVRNQRGSALKGYGIGILKPALKTTGAASRIKNFHSPCPNRSIIDFARF